MELMTKYRELENCQLQIDVEIPPKELKNEYESVKKEFGQYAQIPGFRKGKVPLEIIEKRFKDTIKGKVVENILPKAFKQVVEDKQLKTFGQPRAEKISKYEEDKILAVQFNVDKMPSVKINKIDGIEITEDEITIKKNDLQKEIEHKLQSKSKLEDSQEPAMEGDDVKINVITETVEHKTLNLTEYHLKLEPSNSIPYSLFADIKGMRKGEKNQVKKTFPADHEDERLRGKKISFEIELIEVKRPNLPPLNDETAKEVGFESIAHLEESAKTDLESYAVSYKRNQITGAVLNALIKESSFEIPDSLVETIVDRYIQNLISQFSNNEKLLQPYLASQKKTLTEVKNDYKELAIDRIKNDLIIEKLKEEYNVETQEEDILVKIQKRADEGKRDVKELRKEMIKNGEYTRIKDQLSLDKTIDNVISKGKIKKGKVIPIAELLK